MNQWHVSRLGSQAGPKFKALTPRAIYLTFMGLNVLFHTLIYAVTDILVAPLSIPLTSAIFSAPATEMGPRELPSHPFKFNTSPIKCGTFS